MDMGSSSMAMATSAAMNMAASMTSAAAAASTSKASSMDMGGMGMGMGGASKCKISMLWNWYTIDSCFISSSWHITSSGMFGGSCIGVILLVMTLEAFRRLSKEYDRYLLRNHIAKTSSSAIGASASASSDSESSSSGTTPNKAAGAMVRERGIVRRAPGKFRPNVAQQAVRALLHMVTFAIAYFVMLLAMYYNGYFIICIFIGAFLGNFAFNWETIDTSGDKSDATTTTYCCG